MNDVTLHFGDLVKDWVKFPNAAWGMAFKLLIRYYDQEGPLPDDQEELAFIADVLTDDDHRLLQLVLKRVFVHDAEHRCYRQKRADRELANYQYRRDAAALSNVKKEAKREPKAWPADIQNLTLEQFLEHRVMFQDPVTYRIRFAPSASVSEPKRSRNGAETEPKRSRNGAETAASTSETAPFDPQKPPFLGSLFASLPLSLSASLPDTPKAPQGGQVSGADAAAATGETPAAPDPVRYPPKRKSRAGGVTSFSAEVVAIYAAYPRKVAPTEAMRAISQQIDGGVSAETLLTATRAYAAAVAQWPPEYRRSREGRDLVPLPATWFNRGSYADDPQEWQAGTAGSTSGSGAKKNGGAVRLLDASLPAPDWDWMPVLLRGYPSLAGQDVIWGRLPPEVRTWVESQQPSNGGASEGDRQAA